MVTFVLGYLIERVGQYLRFEPMKTTSLVLLGTYKNTAFAIGLALALFNQQTALPSTVYTIIMLTSVVILDLKRVHNNVN